MKLVVALLAGAVFLSRADADTATARAWYERCREVDESIAPQVAVERAAYLEDLARCATDGTMTAEAANQAAERLERFLAAMNQANLAAMPHAPRQSRESQSELDLLLSSENAALFNDDAGYRLLRQLRVLDRVKREVVPVLQLAACDYAMEAWLVAKKPSDLEGAVRALADVRATVSGWDWGMVAQELGRGSVSRETAWRLRGADGRNAVAELYETQSIVGAPVPFLFPDPGADPAGYAVARADWQALKRINHGFVKRPPVVAHVAELERRLAVELETRRAALQVAMRRHASAKEFDGLLKQWTSLQAAPAGTPRRPQGGYAPQNAGRKPADYREMIAARNSGPPDFGQRGGPKLEGSPELRAYSWWLGFRRAEEAGDPEGVALKKVELDDQLAPLPGTLREAISARYATVPVSTAAPPVTTTEATPIAALLAALEKVPRQLSTGPLLTAWRQIGGAKSRVETDARTSTSPIWFGLAATADGAQLFALRDRAAETVLAEISRNTPQKISSVDAPLDVRLREMIASACLAGEFENASRFLALDEACGALDPDEHAAWRRACGIFQQARQMARDGRGDDARKACVSLIRANRLPEISDVAARVMAGGKLK